MIVGQPGGEGRDNTGGQKRIFCDKQTHKQTNTVKHAKAMGLWWSPVQVFQKKILGDHAVEQGCRKLMVVSKGWLSKQYCDYKQFCDFYTGISGLKGCGEQNNIAIYPWKPHCEMPVDLYTGLDNLKTVQKWSDTYRVFER